MKTRCLILLACCPSLAFSATTPPAPPHPDPCDVVWLTPGKSSADSMPLGNGELGINLWVEENGDLLFYLGRNDSLSEISQLCKVGMVRVSLAPSPFTAGSPFRQHLKLRDGICEISAGKPNETAHIKVFVDAAHPVVHVLGTSLIPRTVTAKVESWRTAKQKVPDGGTAWTLQNAPFELWQEPDVFPAGLPGAVAWYHRNEVSTAFEATVKTQSLEPIRDTMHDPLLHRTFGGWLTGEGFRVADPRTLASASPVTSFALRVAAPCEQTPAADAWLDLARKTADASANAPAALARTASWWQAFWQRSWVECDITAGTGIPQNQHPLRVGADAQGGSAFQGQIGHAAVHDQALDTAAVAKLAAETPRTSRPPQIACPGSKNSLTLEAWINPEAGTIGRILDKISIGGADGFLLDCHPGDSLRFIVGPTILQAPAGALSAGRWQHVAATFDGRSGSMVIYLDGKPVARTGPDTADAPAISVGKAHTLQRYMQACAGRGIYPIKFNGSIFTVEPAPIGLPHNPDWRRWGDCHWWQNVRMPYHAMQSSGDFDLMLPLFEMFERIRPFSEARAKLYHNAAGCYFAETMTVWGTYSNGDYGWDRTGHQPKDVLCPYWQFAWNQGLELVALMLDYHDYTGDEAFLKSRLLPMAESVLRYFDTRFRKDDDGRIVLDPTQAVETYWHGVINDTPTVAGLIDVSERLCALPAAAVPPEQRRFFEHTKAAAPVLPVEEATLAGKKVRRIAVAQKYDPKRSNCENPELFPVWPFRLCGLDRPLLEEARNAYALRGSHNDVGWGYDSNAAALLGLSGEAARILKVKISNSLPGYRWPATWGPNFDWLPDQCHGGNLLNTVHLMLVQHRGDKILLFPAWPTDWDVSFKLHAPRGTVVEATLRGGKVESLKVTPESRAKDVVNLLGTQPP